MSEIIGRIIPSDEPISRVTPQRAALLWLVFFLICLGLGYAPLRRYDPRNVAGTFDVGVYRNIVVGGKPSAVSAKEGLDERFGNAENYYRVLVPYVARPFYRLARGHLGTWDEDLFALLVANGIFTATTACLLVAIGHRLRLGYSVSLLAATLYLLNFCIVNLNLVGLIDSAEGCFLIVIVWSLLADRWFLLPVWGALGVLAKETFAPLSVLFVLGWWMAAARRDRIQFPHLAWIGALALASITTVTLIMSSLMGELVWPWQFAGEMHAGASFYAGLRGCVLNHTFWYIFIWLLPLGVVRLRRLPPPWLVATAMAFSGALILGAYNDARDNTSRALFSIAGPILNISVAVLLASPKTRATVPQRPPRPGEIS